MDVPQSIYLVKSCLSFLSVFIRKGTLVCPALGHEKHRPSVSFIKFILTPQSTLINSAAAYKQHTGAEYKDVLLFLFPFRLTFAHRVKQALACVN